MNVLSLFDGMSCGQIALERAGIKVDNYYASEIDKHAIKVTQSNYPNTIQMGDITKVKHTDLPKIDLLIGGSPCQGFSIAGKQLNFDDERSKLFFEYVRLLRVCKPRYFLLENVNMKKEYQTTISTYIGCDPILINSALVSAQNRSRLYWTNIPNVTQLKNKNISLIDILEDVKFSKPHYIEKYTSNKTTSRMSYKFPTLRANAGSRTRGIGIHKEDLSWRKLTPIECERLQTVPDNYTDHVSTTQRYKMLGNGWTVDVIAHILVNMEIL